MLRNTAWALGARRVCLRAGPARSFVTGGRFQRLPMRTVTPRVTNTLSLSSRFFSSDVDVIDLPMPALSPTMERGVVTQWLKKVGDPIAAGEVIAEIQTDKAVVAYESTEDGFLAAILVEAGGEEIDVGTVVGVMVEEEEEIAPAQAQIASGGSAAPAAPAAAAPAAAPAAPAAPAAAAPALEGDLIELPMPALSPTMERGTITQWLKKVGDPVAAGDVLAEIQTDKAVVAYESTEDGFLAAILVEAGDTEIEVNELVALMVEEEGDIAAVQAAGGAPAAAPAPAPAAAAPAAAAEPMPDVDVIELPMPALSPTMERGTITQWLKKEGDEVSAGDVLAEVQTDKAVVAYESTEDGFLAAILVEAGDDEIEVNELVALMVLEEEEIAPAQEMARIIKSGGAAAAPAAAAPAAAPAAAAPAAATSAATAVPDLDVNGRPFSPAVGHLLRSEHIDPSSITGTGKGGMLLKGDVLKAIKAGTATKLAVAAASAAPAAAKAKAAKPAAAPAAQGEQKRTIGGGLRTYVDHPVTNMRKVIASRLLESKTTIPHAYTEMECKIDNLLALRKQLKEATGSVGSLNDFVIRAAALALRDVPEVNRRWNPSTSSIEESPTVDISIAVATEAGLITPIVPDADHKRISDISKKVKELAGKARENALQPHEFMGGSFTISNLGMFGISKFSAVINPPQACILAVGGGVQKVSATEVEGQIALHTDTMMSVTLSSDERVVDGDLAGAYLQSFKSYIESPMSML